MIEQTEMVVSKWLYQPPAQGVSDDEPIQHEVSLQVQKKRAPTKKGIACRFKCEFVWNGQQVLEYIGEDSYVIDFEEVIDRDELSRMIMNSFTKFVEKYEFRKLNTILYNRSIAPLNPKDIDLEPILPLLVT
ncbi:MAG: hypothetical protein WCP61_08705 [Chitinophagia bacterium]